MLTKIIYIVNYYLQMLNFKALNKTAILWITLGENLTTKFGKLVRIWNREIFTGISNYNYRICIKLISIKNWIVNISNSNTF